MSVHLRTCLTEDVQDVIHKPRGDQEVNGTFLGGPVGHALNHAKIMSKTLRPFYLKREGT